MLLSQVKKKLPLFLPPEMPLVSKFPHPPTHFMPFPRLPHVIAWLFLAVFPSLFQALFTSSPYLAYRGRKYHIVGMFYN